MSSFYYCDCGHFEKKYSIRIVNKKTFCQECWRKYQGEAGLVDTGCIYINAKVCMDREPSVFQDNMRLEEIKKAKCYRGHKHCIKYEAENILSALKRKKEGQPMICPHEGCGRLLTEKITKYYTSLICPVHGVVLKAVLERDE